MDQRISVVTLGVKNLGTAKKFYVDGLGWKPATENEEIIFFQTGRRQRGVSLERSGSHPSVPDSATNLRSPLGRHLVRLFA
jgi:catechol 2,3-dioxygenase-like lactoylglutathione lyase family enzyme